MSHTKFHNLQVKAIELHCLYKRSAQNSSLHWKVQSQFLSIHFLFKLPGYVPVLLKIKLTKNYLDDLSVMTGGSIFYCLQIR